jgi:site-specific DNA recombinase
MGEQSFSGSSRNRVKTFETPNSSDGASQPQGYRGRPQEVEPEQRCARIRAAIYARVSVGFEDEKYSPREQVRLCVDLCKQRGWQPRFIVVEDDSKADFWHRPKWLALLLRASQEKFDVLVTWKTDRWARSLWDTLRTERFLARHNIAYASVTEPFDTSTSYGRFAFRSLANFAELERELNSQRISMAYGAKARQFKWHTRRGPLGYDVLEDYRLRINLAEVAVIDHIWDLFREMKNGPAVAHYLEEKGIRSKWGGSYSAHRIYEILDNALYVGQWDRNGFKAHNEALRIMPDAQFQEMQNLRRRKSVERPLMPADRRKKSIDHVFSQYQESLREESESEIGQEISESSADDLLKKLAAAEKPDLAWRRALSDIITEKGPSTHHKRRRT